MKQREFETQNLARQCNELLLLSTLAGGEMHGYQIAVTIEERSAGFFRFNHGTLYPILHKLEQEGLIEGTWKQERSKRKRKRYALTTKGERYLRTLSAEWREFTRRLSEIVGETKR